MSLSRAPRRGYAVLSIEAQKPDLQFDGLRAYATRAGLDIVREFLDVAVSGRKQGRPQLDALMQAARNYAFDCVLVWKFDRFARSTKHLLTALEELDHLGIRFVSIQDQIDTTSPMGKAMFTLIGAMAELESSLISERVSAGMKAAKLRGKHLGATTNVGGCRGEDRGTGEDDGSERARDSPEHQCQNRARCGRGHRQTCPPQPGGALK